MVQFQWPFQSRYFTLTFISFILFQSDMATPALSLFGSEYLKNEFLTPSISGELVSCIAVSEPGAGSDVAGKIPLLPLPFNVESFTSYRISMIFDLSFFIPCCFPFFSLLIPFTFSSLMPFVFLSSFLIISFLQHTFFNLCSPICLVYVFFFFIFHWSR